MRRFAFAIAFLQLLITLIGFSEARPLERRPIQAIDVVLTSASITRLPERTVEASKPTDQDDGPAIATLPSPSVFPSRTSVRASSFARFTAAPSREATAPRARAPPQRA